MRQSNFHRYALSQGILILLVASALSCAPAEKIAGPEPIQAGTYAVRLDAAPSGLGGVIVAIGGAGTQRVAAGSLPLVMLDSTSSTRRYLVRGAMSVGTRLAEVDVANGEVAPVVIVQEAALGATGGYANVASSAVVLVPSRLR